MYAQKTTTFSGYVFSEKSQPLTGVTVRIADTKNATQTNEEGFYSLTVPLNRIVVIYSRVGYKNLILEIGLLENQLNKQNVTLYQDLRSLDEVQVRGSTNNTSNSILLDAASFQNLPAASGNFESILKTLPGVSSNNELSSQYSVRGGNFDENLVYVNDVEIYRPLLIRNGQQEGLSFINPELAGPVKFSAGGFEARYGDKLSSVLDVKYLRPDSAFSSVSIGNLGNSATIKLPYRNQYFLAGVRLKTNKSLLNSQDTKGAYEPDFSDFQFLFNRDLNKKWNVSFLGNYNLSNFNLEPQSRETKFGTFNEVLRLQVEYNGKEADRYESAMGAFTVLYKPSGSLNIKWINSGFKINERERIDIEGRYVFDEIETAFGNPDFGKVRASRGIGSNLDYARNILKAYIYSSELRMYKQFQRTFLETGIRYQLTNFNDQLNEYSLIDSAGFTLPNNPGPLILSNYVNTQNIVSNHSISGFIQNTFQANSRTSIASGIRANYNSYTAQLLISPRINLSYTANTNLQLKVSAGSYDQQPFYKEFRNFNGSLNPDAKAQRSLHFLTGAEYRFIALNTELKFSSEVYYKHLSRLTPYKIENLRIRYYADQQARGYAAGADFSLGGKFVRELESTFRLSFMKTAEDIEGDFYFQKDASGNTVRIEPGFLKRPSDQRINFSAFFQDRLLKNPANKVHLTLLYGAALPIGPPNTDRYRDVFKIPAYKRVDIGFSKDFLDSESRRKPVFLHKYFTSFVAYAEIFNLLDINNTVSFLWIKDINNNQYAIPNYLTSRQLNIRLIAKFKTHIN
ncbi:TonB-dependent receptor [Daejeonella oryzae]|uniref:TonB-dependent receptor n=1 Tax=Daejeonella oryzae TaxID=1122943 RepID=UPI0012DCC17C|nr:TonB-dependent receptor [Daejeonella oryzae]